MSYGVGKVAGILLQKKPYFFRSLSQVSPSSNEIALG